MNEAQSKRFNNNQQQQQQQKRHNYIAYKFQIGLNFLKKKEYAYFRYKNKLNGKEEF